MGNADAWLLAPHAPESDDPVAARIAEIDFWCLEQLSTEDLSYLQTFRETVDTELAPGVELLAFHGSPRSRSEIVLATTPDEDLEPMLDGARASLLAGGHTHIQMLRRYGSSVLVNPGSVGLPFERVLATGQVLNPPWAEYALVEAADGRLRVELRRVPVEVRAIVRAARESGMPNATWWAEDWMRSGA
jgi:diadenosine tetraphosphatase ApaH/serine/threonine PP2A family protein phosphatase